MELTVRGKSVYAATGGVAFDPARPTVIFLSGAALDHTCWSLQSRWFAWHGFGVLALDLPGHGRSAGPALTSVDDMAEWLGEVIAETGVRDVMLVGHSMGAAVALEAARRNPGVVTRLALLGMAEAIPVHPALLSDALERPERAIASMTDWGHGPTGHIGGNPAPGMWMMGGSTKLFAAADEGVLHNDLKACDDWKSGPETAAHIHCPVLFILGERDRMTPARSARKLAAAIPGSHAEVIAGAGHMLMSEAPDAVLDHLKAFATEPATA